MLSFGQVDFGNTISMADTNQELLLRQLEIQSGNDVALRSTVFAVKKRAALHLLQLSFLRSSHLQVIGTKLVEALVELVLVSCKAKVFGYCLDDSKRHD